MDDGVTNDHSVSSDLSERKIFDDVSEKVLMDPYYYIKAIPGKRIRTKLAQAFNYWLHVDKEKLEIISEATEMLHNASLLIDDIEDNSTLRRGKPVAHTVFGVPHTINSANYIYFVCMNYILKLNHPYTSTIFTEQLLDLHRGQGMDIYWREACECPTEQQYKQMVIRKTGGLFGLAVRLMQLFSSDDRNLKYLCDMLGLYFQIRDDFANLTSKEYEANKTYCEDLTEGKFSFPVIHAVRIKPDNNHVLSILRQRSADLEVKRSCIDYMHSVGSFDYTRSYLMELEDSILAEVKKQGDNPYLTALIEELRKVYQPHESTQ